MDSVEVLGLGAVGIDYIANVKHYPKADEKVRFHASPLMVYNNHDVDTYKDRFNKEFPSPLKPFCPILLKLI